MKRTLDLSDRHWAIIQQTITHRRLQTQNPVLNADLSDVEAILDRQLRETDK